MNSVNRAAKVLAALVFSAALLVSCAGGPAPAPQPQGQPGAPAGPNAAQSRAQAIVQGTAQPGQPAAQGTQPAAQPAAAASVDQPPPPPGVLSPEEQAYLQNYLNRLNYMVYHADDSKLDAKLVKVAVSQANRFLIEKLGLSVIDFDQIEKNKKDSQAAYQSETGGTIDLIQYLAQKLNADVYVELDFATTSETRDGKYYASAQGSMKIYDTSTASLLGSVTMISPAVMSPNSADAALTNAVAASVWNAMPKMTDQTRVLLKNSLARGIRYEVILQKTPDSKQVSTLRRALAKKVREVEQVSYSPNETKLYLYSFMGRDKIEDAMYDAAAAAALPDLNLVYSRGKSFTFSSGL